MLLFQRIHSVDIAPLFVHRAAKIPATGNAAVIQEGCIDSATGSHYGRGIVDSPFGCLTTLSDIGKR